MEVNKVASFTGVILNVEQIRGNYSLFILSSLRFWEYHGVRIVYELPWSLPHGPKVLSRGCCGMDEFMRGSSPLTFGIRQQIHCIDLIFVWDSDVSRPSDRGEDVEKVTGAVYNAAFRKRSLPPNDHWDADASLPHHEFPPPQTPVVFDGSGAIRLLVFVAAVIARKDKKGIAFNAKEKKLSGNSPDILV